MGEAEPPARSTQLPDSVRRAFASFEAHAPLTRALLREGIGDAVRRPARERRLAQLEQTLADALESTDPGRARDARAVIGLLYSAATWRALRDEAGLTSTEAAEAVAWAIETLLAAASATSNETSEGERR